MNHPDNKDNCKATMSSAICEYEASIAKIVLLSINDLEFGLGVNKIAQILTGMQNRFWHVCCSDPKAACPNYWGMPPRDDDRDAANDWIDYCKAKEKNPLNNEITA